MVAGLYAKPLISTATAACVDVGCAVVGAGVDVCVSCTVDVVDAGVGVEIDVFCGVTCLSTHPETARATTNNINKIAFMLISPVEKLCLPFSHCLFHPPC